MNRDIKFRVLYRNKMYFFDFSTLVSYGELEGHPYMNDYGIDAENEVMQYTGLKDKNGKEIYEGDIIDFPDSEFDCNENGNEWYDITSRGEVYWSEQYCKWNITNINDIDLDEIWECNNEIEVLGNIWENPELLEVDNE